MQSLKRTIYLAFFLVAVFFAMPTGKAFAVGPLCDYSKKYEDTKIIYIEATGKDDQNVINTAIKQLDGKKKVSVFLKEGKYVLSGSIQMKDLSMLEGDQETIVTIGDHAGWKTGVPLITAPDGANNMEVKCFQIDGNYNNNTSQAADSCYRPLTWNSNFTDCESKTDDRLFGRGYYNLVHFAGGKDYSVHDMYLHDSAGDGFRVDRGKNVKFYNNLVYKLGHDAVAYYNSEYAEAWRNRITVRTNAGVRVENSNNISVHNNVIEAFDDWSAGGAGIEVVRDDNSTLPMNKIYIYYNTLHHTYGPGVYIVASGTYKKTDVMANINHNIFYETGLSYDSGRNWIGAIVTSGFGELDIESNTFDKVYNYGIVVAITAEKVSSWGYKTVVKNNIIVNTQHKRDSAGGDSGLGGVGIKNLDDAHHMIVVSYNDVWNNVGGNIVGQQIYLGNNGKLIDRNSLGGNAAEEGSLSDNLRVNPQFVNADGNDYHLKKGSPCIDAGDPKSDFAKEPDPNGGRIDMGRYGNTSEAGEGKTGIAAAVGTSSASDGTGVGSPGKSAGNGGSESYASDVKESEYPAYWDPTTAVTKASADSEVNPATFKESGALQSIFYPLGDSASTATATCSVIDGPGGLIPCGRNTNSSDTAWNECDACDLCALVLMGQLFIEFMVKVAAVAANLTIIFAGFLYIFASGKTNLIAQSKSIMKYTILGFVVVFAAWAIVSSLLTILGYIDPVEGKWYTMC